MQPDDLDRLSNLLDNTPLNSSKPNNINYDLADKIARKLAEQNPPKKKEGKSLISNNPSDNNSSQKLQELEAEMNWIEAGQNIEKIHKASAHEIEEFRIKIIKTKLLNENPDYKLLGLKEDVNESLDNFFKDQD